MSTRSMLTREEITLLRTRYLPAIHKEYRDVVDSLNLIADALKQIDGDEIYICDVDQMRLLKKMGVNVLELETAVKNLKLYLKNIAIRLNIL